MIQRRLPGLEAGARAAFLISAAAIITYAVFDDRIFFYKHIGGILASAAALLFVSSCAFGAGDLIISRIKKNYHSRIEHFVICTAAGFGAISLLVFLGGAANLLTRPFAGFLASALFIASLGRIRNFIRKAEFKKQSGRGGGADAYEIALVSIISASAALYFFNCFAPPLNYDTLSYHLAVPKLFMDAGGIRFIPENVYSNFPMNMEFLFLLGMLLRDDSLARLFHFAAGALSCLAVYSFAAKHFTQKAALTASAAFYTAPFVGLLSGWAFNELLLSLYTLLSIFCFCEWAKNSRTEDLAVCSVFCGLAVGTKYTAFLFLLPFLLAAAAVKVRIDGGNARKILRTAAMAGAISLLVTLPWLIKNAVYTHNPVYPFLHGFFNSIAPHPAVGSFDTARFMQQHAPSSVSPGHIRQLLAGTLMSLQTGPFFAAFLPFLLLPKALVKMQAWIPLVYFASYLALWIFFTHQDPRFLIPAIGCLAVPVSSAACSASLKSGRLGSLIRASIVAVLLSNAAWMLFYMARQDIWKAAFGVYGREKFLAESGLYQYPAFSFINEKLPAGARLLFIGENQTYYVDREVISNSPFDTSLVVETVNASGDEEEIRERLLEMGITHILFNASEVKRTAEAYDAFRWAGPAKERLFVRFLSGENRLRKLFSERGVVIWELTRPAEDGQ